MDRRSFLGSAAGAALAGSPVRPNIVLILADDMGFSDIGCYGSEIATPNLDGLARRGVRFTQFYNCARCCPTRSSLMTGLYPHQAGIGYMEPHNRYNRPAIERLRAPQYQGFLNDRCVTLAEALRAAGYQTFMAGKWHVGAAPGQRPMDRGFERFFGIPGGAGSYWKPAAKSLFSNHDPVTGIPDDFYATDYYARYGAKFIAESDPQRPFLLYLAFTAPHWPLEAWPEDIERYRGRYRIGWDEVRRRRLARQIELGLLPKDTKLAPRHPGSQPWEKETNPENMDLRMAVYAAMIDRMDRGIGLALEAIRSRGQEDNTLVLFLSDNGACAEPYLRNAGGAPNHAAQLLPWANASNTPFRLFKHWVHEGGIASPLIACWPARFRGGTINRNWTGHVMDLLPTCLDAAGAPLPSRLPPEGISMLRALRDPDTLRRSPIFWEHEGNRAMRDGRWKLVSYYNEIHEEMNKVGTGPRTGTWELYDLETDRTELDNLAARQPRRLRAMIEQHRAWERRIGVIAWEEILKAGGFHEGG
ncbi:MAG: arylsulfatase [Bryobacter sp.]|nr:arylsulfatase [Bryobacter sp.]